MRKRFVTTILLSLCALCAAFLAACSTDVSGKTYVFSDVTYTGYEEADAATYEAYAEQNKTAMEGVTITFNADGTVTTSQSDESVTWTQSGSTVTIEGEEYTVSGNKLTASTTNGGITITITFVQQ